MRVVVVFLLLVACAPVQGPKSVGYCFTYTKNKVPIRICFESARTCRYVAKQHWEKDPWYPIVKECERVIE